MSLSTLSFTAGCNSRHLRDSSSIFSPQNFKHSWERSSSSLSLDHKSKSPFLLITEASVGEASAIEMDMGVWRKTAWFPFRKLAGFYTVIHGSLDQSNFSCLCEIVVIENETF